MISILIWIFFLIEELARFETKLKNKLLLHNFFLALTITFLIFC